MSLIQIAKETLCEDWKPQSKFRQYVHLYLGPTEQCGLGLFTARSFTEGEPVLVVEDPGYLRSAVPYSTVIGLGYGHTDILQVGEDLFLPPYGAPDDFTNHSCEPNCGLVVHPSGFFMKALRNIRAGEELTYDYSTHQENAVEAMLCCCGTASCRGVIRSFSTLPADVQARYLGLGVVASFISEKQGARRFRGCRRSVAELGSGVVESSRGSAAARALRL
jgi:hypothetical protein